HISRVLQRIKKVIKSFERAAGANSSQAGLSSRSLGISGRKKHGDRVAHIRCQFCKAVTIPGLDLGNHPIAHPLLSLAELNRPETFYPLRLQHCPGCGLTQLSYIPNPKVVYRNFPFVSGTTKTATRHLQSLPRQLVRLLNLGRTSFALDIGSNDG